MITEQTATPLIARVTPYLPFVERILLTALLVGVVLTIMEIDLTVTRVSLFGLAGTYFQLAFNPPSIPQEENGLLGFSELLGYIIVPKVLWISAAISLVGIAFYVIGFNDTGFKNMVMIGGFSIAIGSLVLVVLLVSGVRHLRSIAPVLFRAVPICLIDFYILFKYQLKASEISTDHAGFRVY